MLKSNLREEKKKICFKGENEMAARRGGVGIHGEAADTVCEPSSSEGSARPSMDQSGFGIGLARCLPSGKAVSSENHLGLKVQVALRE